MFSVYFVKPITTFLNRGGNVKIKKVWNLYQLLLKPALGKGGDLAKKEAK